MSIVVKFALFVFRVIAAVMLAGAVGAFAASAMLGAVVGAFATSFLTGPAEWAWDTSWPAFGLAVTIGFGIGSIRPSAMMPRAAALTRPVRDEEDKPARGTAAFMVAGLGVIAVLFVPSVLTWGTERQTLLRDLIRDRPDPLGFNLIPAVMLLAAPVLAGLAIASFAAASMLALVAPSSLVPRVLTACAIQQGCLVAGLVAVERGFRAIGNAVQEFVKTSGDHAASAVVTDWMSRFDATVGRFDMWLAALCGGYLVARATASPAMRSRVSVPDEDTNSVDMAATGSRVPAPNAHLIQVHAGTASRPQTAPLPAVPLEPPDFDYSTYSVRARHTWVEFFGWRPTEYDITTVPASPRARFCYSWRTGLLRREPNGPGLVSVRWSGGLLAPSGRSCSVADARTGAPIGTLRPRGSVWEIRNPSGALAADVVQIEEGVGRARYVAMADGKELCKFLWGFTGLTVASAELQIDFLPAGEGRLSRALTMALGPILERQARRASQRHSS